MRCHLFLLPTRHLSPAGPAGRGSNIISKLNYGLFARFISALKCMKKFQEVPVRTAVNNGECLSKFVNTLLHEGAYLYNTSVIKSHCNSREHNV